MILALDLGTLTGFAYGPNPVVSGTWVLKSKFAEDPAVRFQRLEAKLTKVQQVTSNGIKQVYYEKVQRHIGTYAAHVYGGLVATMGVWCLDQSVSYEGVAVGTIKKAWTGRGNAVKSEMIAEAIRRGFEPGDDNEADALALLHMVMK